MSLESPPRAGLTRALSFLIIGLMLAAVCYAGWIAVRYWGDIGV
ncbi:MAG TPA: hypothetical protein VHR43_05355 [Gemmatimonadales bacterium]|jgi:hypothetical protein|nr:hypothetical protein [Gemmatimonadales bacterium]